MKPEKSAITLIASSILWAAAMIGSSLVLAGTEYSEKVFYLLLTLSTSSFLMFPDGYKSIQSEWSCIRKHFGALSKSE
jgi:hypothetical protein